MLAVNTSHVQMPLQTKLLFCSQQTLPLMRLDFHIYSRNESRGEKVQNQQKNSMQKTIDG